MARPAKHQSPKRRRGKTERRVIWQPNAGPQTQFLASTAFELLYGGAAGGGKSEALTINPLRWSNLPDLYAITFRREYPQLEDLLQKARGYYPRIIPGALERTSPFPHWRFPAGGQHRYGHCADVNAWAGYQGHEFSILQFDELTHFTKTQYLELVSRVRKRKPGFVRSTTNPGGEGHDWVFERFGAWLNPDFEADGITPRFDEDGRKLPPAKPGEILWILHQRDGTEVYVPKGTPKAQSRQFIPARLEDNPKLWEADPQYEQRLLDNDPHRVDQLRYGDWLSKPAAGKLFQRGWVEVIDAVPADIIATVRFWDLAATEEKLKAGKTTNDPDYTSGVRLSMTAGGLFIVEDCISFRSKPDEAYRKMFNTATQDGRRVHIGFEVEGGSSGKWVAQAICAALNQFWVQGYPATGSKIVRFGPFSAQAKAGNVKVLRGAWNKHYFDVLERFPDGKHDDEVDATSGAHMAITSLPRQRPTVLLPAR